MAGRRKPLSSPTRSREGRNPSRVRRWVVSRSAWVCGLGLAGTDILAQCAMCGTALSSPEDPLARGIGWSVVFLISVPLALVGSIGGWLFLAHRRASRPGPAVGLFSFRRGTDPGGCVGVQEVER